MTTPFEQQIRKHEERCMKTLGSKFVHWYWMVCLLGAIVLTVGGSAWALSAKYSKTDSKAEMSFLKNIEQDRRLDKMENVSEDIKLIKEYLKEILASK